MSASEIFTPEPDFLRPEWFAGRHSIYARLRQYITESPDYAMIFAGRDGIGKSALLRHFNRIMDEMFIGVYLPLSEIPLESETDWLGTLVAHTTEMLLTYQFSPERIPPMPHETEELRDWLLHEYLPEVIYIIRPRRRLVWLIDDAEFLIQALHDRQLPPDSARFLHQLMQAFSQVSIVMTISTEAEHRLTALAPLYHPAIVQRIGRLTAEECRALLQQIAPGLSEPNIQMIDRMTGGNPRLLQRAGNRLTQQNPVELSGGQLTIILRELYNENMEEFRSLWKLLGREERIVFTAAAHLLRNSTTQTIHADAVQGWLRAHDTPVERIPMNAALRSLEYRELLLPSTDGLSMGMGFMQQWVLENTHIEDYRLPSRARLTHRQRVLLIGALGFVTLLLLVFSLIPPPERGEVIDVPTVTLAP